MSQSKQDDLYPQLVDFIEEITRANGRYVYLDKTPIVADAYALLAQTQDDGDPHHIPLN